MIFYQVKNNKVIGIPIMVLLVTLISFPMGITYGYDGVKGIPLFTTLTTQILASLWVILLIGWVINANTISTASKKLEDKYWRTQLVRFKDPKYNYIKTTYFNWRKREKELEQMWLNEYGTKYENTEQPFIGAIHFVWFIISATLGLFIGIGIGSI